MSKSMQQYILNSEIQWIHCKSLVSFIHCILLDTLYEIYKWSSDLSVAPNYYYYYNVLNLIMVLHKTFGTSEGLRENGCLRNYFTYVYSDV